MTSRPPSDTREPLVAFDPSSGRLRRGPAVLTLRPKDAAVLYALASKPGRLVTKAALLAAVWPDVWVTEAVLKAAINRLRAALSDAPSSPRFIETVHRRGYRLIGTVSLDATAAADGVPLTSSLVVGRTAETASLTRAFDDAVAGAHRMVFISGEAGYGKTALLEHFLTMRLRGDVLVGRGQCVERYGAGEAYMPLFAVLRDLCETARSDVISRLAVQAPGWLSQMPGLQSPEDLERVRQRASGVSRDRMLREFVDAMASLAREQPVVIAIEDLHWSDASTLDAIAMLARRRDPTQLLVVGTYRPEVILPRGHPLLAFAKTLRAQRLSIEVSLPLLSLEAVEAYLAARFPGAEIAPEIARGVHQRTEGHPLFLSALADLWVAHDWLAEEGGRWRRSVDPSVLTLTVPADVRDMVEVRLDRLSDPERRVIESASVCGPVFTAASVAAAQQTEVVRADEHCAAIARRHLLIRADGEETWGDGTRTGRYRFAHALYRDGAYERVPAARRQQMHRRVALREEAGHSSQAGTIAARLAMHFEAAADGRRAVRYRTIAARNASAIAGFGEAIGHATAALNTLHSLEGPTTDEELAVQLVLGASRAATEGFAAASAERAYARARELTLRATDSIESIQAMAGLFAFHLMRGPVDVTGDVAQRLRECAERTGYTEAVAWSRSALGVQRLQCGDMAAANDHFTALLSIYDVCRRQAYQMVHVLDPNSVGLGYSSWALWMLGCPSRALERGREAIAFAESTGHAVEIAHAFVLQAHLHQFRQDLASTLRCAETAIRWSEEYGIGQFLWPAKIMRGWARASNGDGAGLVELQQAQDLWNGTGARYARPRHAALRGELHLRTGDLAAAERALADALTAAAESGERFWEPETRRLIGELHVLRAEDREGEYRDRCLRDAWQAVEQSIDLARQQGARMLELRALASLCRIGELRGEVSGPRRRLAEVCDQFDAAERDHHDWREAADALSRRT